MKRTVLIAIMVVALVMGLVAYAFGATSGKVDVTANVPNVLSLTIDGADASTVAEAVTFSDFNPDGVNQAVVPVVRVKSNQDPWTLEYTATDFTYGENSFPVSVMTYGDTAKGISDTAFSQTGNITTEGTRGVTKYNFTYKINMTDPDTEAAVLAVPAGDYTSNIVYTVTVP